jgi:hypothetical protein
MKKVFLPAKSSLQTSKTKKSIKKSIQYVPYVFYPRSSILRSLLPTTAITVYRTDSDARDDTYDKWHYEKVYNCVHLCVAVVRRHHDGFVFLRVKARKNCTFISVSVGEVFTPDARWICWRVPESNEAGEKEKLILTSASFDIH